MGPLQLKQRITIMNSHGKNRKPCNCKIVVVIVSELFRKQNNTTTWFNTTNLLINRCEHGCEQSQIARRFACETHYSVKSLRRAPIERSEIERTQDESGQTSVARMARAKWTWMSILLHRARATPSDMRLRKIGDRSHLFLKQFQLWLAFLPP